MITKKVLNDFRIVFAIILFEIGLYVLINNIYDTTFLKTIVIIFITNMTTSIVFIFINEMLLTYSEVIHLQHSIENAMSLYNSDILIVVDPSVYKTVSGYTQNVSDHIVSINDMYGIIRWINDMNDSHDGKEIIIIIHTNGGDVKVSDAVFNVVLRSRKKIRAYIPYYAYSAGSMLALACNTIHVLESSIMSPVDPQITITHKNTDYTFSSYVYKTFLEKIKHHHSDDIIYLESLSALSYHTDNLVNLKQILTKRVRDKSKINKLIDMFGSGTVPHEKPYFYDVLYPMGLHIRKDNKDFSVDIIDRLRKTISVLQSF